jgi:predicted ATP-dependent endonuclease of OLD family
LFFGKAVMLVEGLSEAILLPVIAKRCLGFDIDDKGISIVAVQGVSFRPFANLFGPQGIRRRCAILTDSDPGQDVFPLTAQDPDYQPCQRVINLQNDMDRKQGYVRVFASLKTLEHDIVVSGNRRIVEQALKLAVDLNEKITGPSVQEAVNESELRAFSSKTLDAVSGAKGAFAQALAEKIAEEQASFQVPSCITQAFDFLLNQDEQEGENGG